MKLTAEVVIVGAGFAGAATAYHLALRGVRDLVLVEREQSPGLHASGRNAAMLREISPEPAWEPLLAEGAEFLRRGGEAATFAFNPCGSLLLGRSGDLERLAPFCAAARARGLRPVLLNPGQAAARVPALRGAAMDGAWFTPSDGVVGIERLLWHYLDRVTRSGGRLRLESEVKGFDIRDGLIRAVRAGSERIETGCVVNAAGAWAGEVGRLAGAADRGLSIYRRHLFVTARDEAIDPAWPLIWDVTHDFYLRPEAGGWLASPCDHDPHPAGDPAADPAAFDRFTDKAARVLPALGRPRPQRGWAGLRTFAPGEGPWVGRDPAIENLFWVAGLGGHGVTASYAVGRAAADAVLGRAPRAAAAAAIRGGARS